MHSKIFFNGISSNRDLIGYNISRDGSVIDFTTTTSYDDFNVSSISRLVGQISLRKTGVPF